MRLNPDSYLVYVSTADLGKVSTGNSTSKDMKVLFFVLRDKKPLFCCCVNAHGNIGKTAREKKKSQPPFSQLIPT